ncbi:MULTISPECIES: hypothetical protein [Chromobacterium]|uniref:Uncharacterized protein n=1 Tax=Chromobacterium rhizoryzae TaxID=1778675 RepID=A0AAD0RSC7_9NEIS|nr:MULTISPECIES: hypothetical protein [Chromobacterium]AXT46156.1 hypothetical protein D1345_08165 [Chromobacterium rhizoryzae]PTU70499.1 hypothetical protein DBB33_14110 [Chromobacterium haemolyticum]
MSEPSKPKEPDWSGLNLPVLTEVVDESQVPTLGDEVIDIPDFDFSSELDALADQLGEPPQELPAELEIPELSLEELIAAPAPGEEPLLDLASLPSLDLNEMPASELGIEQVLPGWNPAVALPEVALPTAEAGDFEFSLQPAGEEPPAEALADEFASIEEEPPTADPAPAPVAEPLVAEAEPAMGAALEAAEPEPVGIEIPDAVAPTAASSAPTPFTSISLDSLPTGVLGGGVGPETQVDSLLPSWPESAAPEPAEAPSVGAPEAAAEGLEPFAPPMGENAVDPFLAQPEADELAALAQEPVPAFDDAPAAAPEAVFESAMALPDEMMSPEFVAVPELSEPEEEPLLAEIDQALEGLQTAPAMAMPEAVEAEAHEPPAAADELMMDAAIAGAAAEPLLDEALEPQIAELDVPQLDAVFGEPAEAEPVLDEVLEPQAAEPEASQLDAAVAEPEEAEAAAEPVLDEALEPQVAELDVPQLDAVFAELAEAEAVAEPVLDEALESQAAEPEVPHLDAAFAEPEEAEAVAEPVLDQMLEPQAAEPAMPLADAEPESLALAEGEIPELTALESETEADGMGTAELAAGAGALAAAGRALAAGAASSGESEREAVSDAPAARGVEVLKVSELASAAAAAAMMTPQAVNAPSGTVAVIDEQALLQSMYEQMLPRMKVELSLWLQDALELQAKQMLSGVMHQLKEDYEMLFGEALKESLRQTINSLGKIEKEDRRDE